MKKRTDLYWTLGLITVLVSFVTVVLPVAAQREARRRAVVHEWNAAHGYAPLPLLAQGAPDADPLSKTAEGEDR